MNYEETIELESNIKIKDKANKIYKDFLHNVKLEPGNFTADGRFIFWKDSHNATYFAIENGVFIFQCRFLHEKYNVEVTPSGIFNALKNSNRGVEHLEAAVRNK